MNQNKFEKDYMELSWQKQDKPYKKFIIEDSIKQFNSFLSSKSIQGTLLDIGCGSGKNSIFFAKQGFSVKGTDFSNSALKLAKKNAKERNSAVKFKLADVIEDDFKEQFDVVLDCGCLHHIRKKYWRKYLKNILVSIKQGGYFYLHGFGDNSHKLGFAPKNRNWHIKKGHYTHFFSDKEIKELFYPHFKIIKKYEFTSLTKKFIVKAFYMQRKQYI